uniref:CTCK domain-containing protein n=1 Tax=Lepisosteus oculatus TaxID=7918 RepID=W5NG31_LEPOC
FFLLRGTTKSTGFTAESQVSTATHTTICRTPEPPVCRGPLGEIKAINDTWESKCHTCTCNITNSVECKPKNVTSTTTCKDNEILVTINKTDCCQTHYCVEKTCEYKGQIYKVGHNWTDPSQPCHFYSCEKSGIILEKKMCPELNCPEEQRIWDNDHCCYTCKETCSPKNYSVNVNDSNCFGKMETSVCVGQCESQHRWELSGGIFTMKQKCRCCQAEKSENREISLTCNGDISKKYNYTYITSCRCHVCD